MKKLIIITAIFSFLTLELSFAHGGRTDKDGCHKNKGEEGRHCHEATDTESKSKKKSKNNL